MTGDVVSTTGRHRKPSRWRRWRFNRELRRQVKDALGEAEADEFLAIMRGDPPPVVVEVTADTRGVVAAFGRAADGYRQIQTQTDKIRADLGDGDSDVPGERALLRQTRLPGHQGEPDAN